MDKQELLNDMAAEIKRRKRILDQQQADLLEVERLAKERADLIIKEAKDKAQEEADQLIAMGQQQLEHIEVSVKKKQKELDELNTAYKQLEEQCKISKIEAEQEAKQIIEQAQKEALKIQAKHAKAKQSRNHK